jgi:hypothetical protein
MNHVMYINLAGYQQMRAYIDNMNNNNNDKTINYDAVEAGTYLDRKMSKNRP